MMVMRRRLGFAAVLVVVASCVSGAASARTLRPKWIDSQPWGRGHIVYRTSKIWVRNGHFAVTTSVTNRTRYRLKFVLTRGWTNPLEVPASFGIAYRNYRSSRVISPADAPKVYALAAATVAPALPRVLRPGRTWHGTFVGYTPLLRTHRDWWVVFGLVSASADGTLVRTRDSYWFSSRTFRS